MFPVDQGGAEGDDSVDLAREMFLHRKKHEPRLVPLMLLCKLDWKSSVLQTPLLQGAIPISTVAAECVSGSLSTSLQGPE